MTRWWLTTRIWIWLPALLLLASSCRTEKDVRVSTQYVRVYERDSVYIDCTDTLYVVERGDTVRITETKTVREYRYKILRDTAIVTDTVAVMVRTGAAADRPKPCRRLFFFIAGAATSILIIFAAKMIVWFLTKKT